MTSSEFQQECEREMWDAASGAAPASRFYHRRRPRRTPAERAAMQQEALSRVLEGESASNWPAIFQGFMAKGIPESEIKPRENVFTYHAWRALGRQVRRGEHGVKVTTWIAVGDKDGEEAETPDDKPDKPRHARICRFATVFHVSQTDPIAS
jgi:hypothetical protein